MYKLIESKSHDKSCFMFYQNATIHAQIKQDEMNYHTYSLKTDKDRLAWPTVLARRGKKKDKNLEPLWNAF